MTKSNLGWSGLNRGGRASSWRGCWSDGIACGTFFKGSQHHSLRGMLSCKHVLPDGRLHCASPPASASGRGGSPRRYAARTLRKGPNNLTSLWIHQEPEVRGQDN